MISQHNARCRDTDLICTDGKQFGPTSLMCERRKHFQLLYHIMLWSFLMNDFMHSCIIYLSQREYWCPVWSANVRTKMDFTRHLFYKTRAVFQCLLPSPKADQIFRLLISDYISHDVICTSLLCGVVYPHCDVRDDWSLIEQGFQFAESASNHANTRQVSVNCIRVLFNHC